MQFARNNVFARDDTFFGVCEALGEDFGFHPNLLRVVLAVLLFFNPVAVLAGYAAAAVIVGGSRWLYPNPRIEEPAPQAELVEAEADEQLELLAKAA